LLISKNKFDDDFQEYLIRRDQKKWKYKWEKMR
jgi:hypothetical protein